MLAGIFRTMRPHQWVKNLFVVAPLVFAKELGVVEPAVRTVIAFALFCLASSTIYLINDLADVEADRAHPVKKNRPIASGRVSEGAAKVAAGVLALTALGGSFALGLNVLAPIAGYLLLNVAYTFSLKRVAYVDVLCIATGFELRVLAGTFAAMVDPTLYLLVVTFLLATFLGFGKRMHELIQGTNAKKQRAVLENYSKKTLTGLLYATSAATLVTYAVYTLDPSTATYFGTVHLWATIPFTLFGVGRFLNLVLHRPEAESPTEEMLRDKPFLLNLVFWGAAVVAIIYLT